MKKILKSLSIGLGIGFTCDSLIVLLLNGQQTGKQLLSVWIMSAIIGLISLVFYSRKLSLLVKTLIQFVGSLTAFLATAFYNQWIVSGEGSWMLSIGIFFLIFIIIWLAIYFYTKNQIKKINHSISKNK